MCKMVKARMQSKNIAYTEINAESPEGEEIIEKYDVMSLPFVVDGESALRTVDKIMKVL